MAVQTEVQYSSVRLEPARSVSSLLYGILFLKVLVANFEFVGFAPKPKYTNWTISMETICTANPNGERTNQNAWICLRLALPLNNYQLFTEVEVNSGGYYHTLLLFYFN